MRGIFNFRQSPHVLIVVCVVTTVVIISVTVYPWIGDIMQMSEEVATNDLLLREILLPKVSLLNSLSGEELDSSIAALEEALPSSPQEWSVFASLEAIARESQVQLGLLNVSGVSGDLGPAVSEGGSPVRTITVPIAITGDTSQIIVFFKNVERAKRILTLADLSLENDAGLIHLTGKAIAPYLPVPRDLGPIEALLEGLTVADQEVLAQVARLNLYGLSFRGLDKGKEINFGKSNPF